MPALVGIAFLNYNFFFFFFFERELGKGEMDEVATQLMESHLHPTCIAYFVYIYIYTHTLIT